MAEIGETIKKIRKGKGILQKDLYKDIVSNTFATQFEKGVYRINTDSFLKILDRLLMNSKEFQKIHTDFKKDEYTLLSYFISDAINNKDIKRLEGLLDELEQYKNIPQHSLLKALAKMNIERIKGKTLDEDNPNVKVIVQFLSKIDSWTLSDVAFLTNFLPFVPYNMLLFQIKTIEEKLKKQNEVRLLCYFYNNLLDRAFLEKDYQNARVLCTRLEEVAQEPEFLFFKLIAQLFSDLLEIDNGYSEFCMERINAIVTFLEKYASFDFDKEFSIHIHDLQKNKYT